MSVNNKAEKKQIAQGPLGVPLSHVGFCVADIDEAVEFWTSRMHAGPFFLLDPVPFDRVEAFGEPAIFDQSVAFGQWGDIAVELQQFHRVEPGPLRSRLELSLNHIAYIAADAEAASARLEAAGMPMYFFIARGPMQCRFHSLPTVAHSLETHQASAFLGDFFSNLRAASLGWSGDEPLRAGAPPS